MPVNFSTEEPIQSGIPTPGVAFSVEESAGPPVGIPAGFEPGQIDQMPSTVKFSVEEPVAKPTIGVGETAANIMKGLGRGIMLTAQVPGQMIKWAAESNANPEGTSDFKKIFSKNFLGKIPAPADGEPMGEYMGKSVETLLPVWAKNVDEWSRRAATRFGQNIIDYYKRGIEGDILSDTPAFAEARKYGWTTAPVQKALIATAESAPQYVAALAAGLVTKSPEIPLAMMGEMTAAQSYGQMRDANVKPDMAGEIAMLNGAWEAATEKIPFDMIFNDTSKHLLSRFLKIGTVESFQELIQNTGQNYLNHIGENYDPAKPETLPVAAKIGMGELFNGWFESMSAGFLMGGAAALATGLGPRQAHIVNQTENPKPVDDINVIQDMKQEITDNTTLTAPEKEAGLLYVGDIETKIVKQIIDQYPKPVYDGPTATLLTHELARDLGLPDPEKYSVTWLPGRKQSRGTWAHINRTSKVITIAAGSPEIIGPVARVWTRPGHWESVPNETPGQVNQKALRMGLVHELGHSAEPPYNTPTGRKMAHHKTFVNWVAENVKTLYAEQQKTLPIAETAVPPIPRQEPSGITPPTLPQVGQTPQGPAQITQEKVTETIVKTHNENGGSTINLETGKPITEGFSVAISKDYGQIIPGDKLTAEQLDSYKQKHQAVLDADKRRTVGTWVDNGNTYLDISTVLPTEKEAIEVGKANEQLAIFDLKNFKTIPITTEGVPVGENQAADGKKIGLSRKRLLSLGHSIPNLMGWDANERIDFMRKLTDKTSMKDMSLEEMRKVVEAIQAESTKQGFVLETGEKASPVEELITTLQQSHSKITSLGYNSPKVRKLVYELQSLLHKGGDIMRLPIRLFDLLDGGKDGPWHRLIFQPLMDQSAFSRINTDAEIKEFAEFFKQSKIDADAYIYKADVVPGTKHRLTTMERLGVYGLSENEAGYERLQNADFTSEDIAAIRKSVTPQEKTVLEFCMNKFEEQWIPLVNAAVQAGWDVSTLKKELRYVPIENQDSVYKQDFIEELADFTHTEARKPDSRMLLQRVPGAKGRMNLDLAQLYFNNATRVQRFMAMAPLAKQLRGIMHNSGIITELNKRTFGQGAKLLNEYIATKIRGGLKPETSGFENIMAWLRHKGTTFAAARNVLILMRQTLALCTTMADDANLAPYVIKHAASLATKGGVQNLSEFVTDSSIYMKDRALSNNVQRYFNLKSVSKALEEKNFDYAASKWYVGIDKLVANIAWKSYYELSMDKLSPGDMRAAMIYADERTQKTQSLVHTEDLSMLYKGGELSKNIVAFTREMATLGNYWYYDVYQAKAKGEIGWGKMGYRVMMSYMIPALIFGMISRGRPQRDKKELLTDATIYLASPSIFLGGLMNRLMTGLDSGLISFSVFDSLYGVIQQAKKLSNWENMTDEEKAATVHKLMKKAAMTIGSLTGKLSAQDIRTIEGAYDLYMKNTTDPRRLIWSDYGLNKGPGTEQTNEESTTPRRR